MICSSNESHENVYEGCPTVRSSGGTMNMSTASPPNGLSYVWYKWRNRWISLDRPRIHKASPSCGPGHGTPDLIAGRRFDHRCYTCSDLTACCSVSWYECADYSPWRSALDTWDIDCCWRCLLSHDYSWLGMIASLTRWLLVILIDCLNVYLQILIFRILVLMKAPGDGKLGRLLSVKRCRRRRKSCWNWRIQGTNRRYSRDSNH